MLQLALIGYHPLYYTWRTTKQVQRDALRIFLGKPSFALGTFQLPLTAYQPPSTLTPKTLPSVALAKALATALPPGFKHATLVYLRTNKVEKA